MSLDGHTTLVGNVFAPHGKAGRAAAMLMMHGRAGAYSSEANGRYDASTLSKRHRMWGELWASLGYVAILVDGFGPPDFRTALPRFSYDQRPESLNEITVRPLDAYGGLAYLRTRRDVIADHVGLQGWSNGGSATLASMAEVAADTPGAAMRGPTTGFRAALAFYPACGLKGMFEDGGYKPYAPVRVLQGDADEEVSPSAARPWLKRVAPLGGDIEIKFTGRHARFRRSGALAAKRRSQCCSEGRRFGAGADFFRPTTRKPDAEVASVARRPKRIRQKHHDRPFDLSRWRQCHGAARTSGRTKFQGT